MNENRTCELILALDQGELEEIRTLLTQIGPSLRWVKVGLKLFTAYGPGIVQTFSDMGYSVFLDLKLHDIPYQVAQAIRSLKDLPIGMLTLHASGGSEMLKWAAEARNEINHSMKLLAVTVLTSMDQEALNAVGVSTRPQEQVVKLGHLAHDSGVDGLVSSPLELELLRHELGPKPVLVTPGIRPENSELHEQKRVMTPVKAAQLGSSYIVVGRPIYEAQDPQAVVASIHKSISTEPVG